MNIETNMWNCYDLLLPVIQFMDNITLPKNYKKDFYAPLSSLFAGTGYKQGSALGAELNERRARFPQG